jgi:hypothetical protein
MRFGGMHVHYLKALWKAQKRKEKEQSRDWKAKSGREKGRRQKSFG